MRQYIIVVGGAGFIGSHLCDALLANDKRIICIDNLLTGHLDNIAQCHNKSFIFIKANACQNNILKIIKSKVAKLNISEIYYLASIASPKLYIQKPIDTITTNVYGLHNFLDIARLYQSKLIYTSTSEVYGNPVVNPQSESYTGNVDPNGNRAVYDESKRLGETLVTTYQKSYNLDTRIIRIFNTYGARMQPTDGRVIPTFLTQAINNQPLTIFGDGQQTRSFCHIIDLINGIIDISKISYHNPINLGNPYEYYSILELAQLIQKITNSSSTITFEPSQFNHEPQIRKPDIARMQQLTGWQPQIPIEMGLYYTLEYIRQQLRKI